jgi:hypothetical protein
MTLLAQESGILPEHWWIWALFLAALILLMIIPRRLARRSRVLDDPARGPSPHEALRRSMDQLLVELQETSREINATIDTKMIALNRLIEEADHRIETLRELRRPGGAAGTPASPAREELPLSAEALKRRELEREIYRLADEGKTELEIARITRTPRGEVELVLSLRRTARDEPTPRNGAS